MTTPVPTRRKSDRTASRLQLTLATLAVTAWGMLAVVAYEAHAKSATAQALQAE
jgi:hypothetical protein